jgi:hypothetical protein
MWGRRLFTSWYGLSEERSTQDAVRHTPYAAPVGLSPVGLPSGGGAL